MPGRTPLEMPYAIDGDKVGGQSIKYMFAKVMRPLCPRGYTEVHCAGQVACA